MIFHLVSLLIFGIAIQGHEDFRAEPHIRQTPWQPNSISHHDDDNTAANDIPPVNTIYFDEYATTSKAPPSGPPPVPLPVVNRPLQVTLLAVIMTFAVVANGSVIANISRDSLKLRMVHFLLIRHVCIADCLGTMLVLPVPLVAMIQGEWRYGDTVCAAVSTTTASLWTMHLLAVALYRGDRVLAVWLSPGQYPIFSVRTTNICLVLVWVVAILGSYGATITFGHTFQPALALCIPNVPLVFFIIVFAGYCVGLVGLTTGYVLAFVRRRRRKRKRERESKLYAELCDNAPFEPTPDDLIEDVESCGGASSERSNRHRRALSDQYNSASKSAIFTPSSRLTHRRVWSESAAAYCTSNLTSIVARSTQMSCDSSSFPQNSSDTNINDYERLTEDYGSSDLSVRKLTHSMSFDEASLSSQPPPPQDSKDLPDEKAPAQQVTFGGKGSNSSTTSLSNAFPQNDPPSRRSHPFAQSKSFDQADIRGRNKRCRHHMPNHLNSMSMHESITPSSGSRTDFRDVDESDKGMFTSNFVIVPTQPTIDSTAFTSPSPPPHPNNEDVADPNVLPKRISLHRPLSDSVDAESPRISVHSKQTSIPLSLSSLTEEGTTPSAHPPSTHSTTIGVIIENQSSNFGSADSIHDVVPPLAHPSSARQAQSQRLFGHHYNNPQRQHPTNQELYEITNVDLPPHSSLSTPNPQPPSPPRVLSQKNSNRKSSNNGEAFDSTELGSNNNRNVGITDTNPDANFKAKRSGESDNNNVLQVRMVPKKRPRTRVKHFRPKGKTGPAKRAIASYAVSVGHLLLYLPAMFVVGLKGATLPPGAALFCGIVVYCEFLVQPIALLLVSPRLRIEVIKTIYCFIGRR